MEIHLLNDNVRFYYTEEDCFNKFINIAISYGREFVLKDEIFSKNDFSNKFSIKECNLLNQFFKNYDEKWTGDYVRSSVDGEYYGFNFKNFAILFELGWEHARIIVDNMGRDFIIPMTSELKEKIKNFDFSKYIFDKY